MVFSFLAAFSEFEYNNENVIILLDEPAVSLHAKAQRDFLRFINERLSPVSQVIYTTHSPFMIEPDQLSRVRIVEDKGPEKGAVVSGDVLTVDQESLFPLQGALGYDLAQHLFISPHNLVVEGTSDFTYLKLLSDYLNSVGRIGLDEKWTIVPVGGADLVPTFVALLGTHLDVTVLVDARKEGHQRLNLLQNQGLLAKKRLITIGDVLDRPAADIEDLFATDDYLTFFNSAFDQKLKEDGLNGVDPIVRRLARAQGVDRFDHGLPAQWLLMNRAEVLSRLTAETLDRFEKLFIRVNSTL